ncbi:MAG: hypothetical protein QM756_45735 [Polyangiaceae bacterium]
MGRDFCWACFKQGVGEAFFPGLLMGAGVAAALAVVGAIYAPAAVVIGVGVGLHFAYQMLDTHFGWSGGKPFEQMTPEEKSRALGRLVGGTAGAVVGGLAVGAVAAAEPGTMPVKDIPGAKEIIDGPGDVTPGDEAAGLEGGGDEAPGGNEVGDEAGAQKPGEELGDDATKSGEEGPGEEGTGEEGTGEEGTGEEGTGEEGTGEEGTGEEGTGEEAKPRPEKNSPEDIDQRVEKLKNNPNVTSDPAPDGSGRSVLDVTGEKARNGDPGSIGELEAIERHAGEGSKVRVRTESTEPNQTSPDLDVDGKMTEVKTRTEPLTKKNVAKLITDANNQVKNSGEPGPGQADIQLNGKAAESELSDSDLNRQVRSNFNEKNGRSLDQVNVFRDGEKIGTWERDPTTGKVNRTFPEPPETPPEDPTNSPLPTNEMSMKDAATVPTWGGNDSYASWVFQASPAGRELAPPHPLEDPSRRALWLSKTLDAVVRALPSGTVLERAEIGTVSKGEDAYTSALTVQGAWTELTRYLGECLDFDSLRLSFSPPCVDSGGQAFLLRYGFELGLRAEKDDDDALIWSREHPVEVTLDARTSLFTEATFEGNGDNRAWARPNRPLLSGMLSRLGGLEGLSVAGSASDKFPDQVTAAGFLDLAADFQGYLVSEGEVRTYSVERRFDGREVVEVHRFEVNRSELGVEYTSSLDVRENTARLLILEHFVPEIAKRHGAITMVRLNNIKTKRVASLPWTPVAAAMPVPWR